MKGAVKSGTAEHRGGGDKDGMLEALLEMAAFCDRQLRLKEDDGKSWFFVACRILKIS